MQRYETPNILNYKNAKNVKWLAGGQEVKIWLSLAGQISFLKLKSLFGMPRDVLSVHKRCWQLEDREGGRVRYVPCNSSRLTFEDD